MPSNPLQKAWLDPKVIAALKRVQQTLRPNMELEDAADVIWLREQIERLETQIRDLKEKNLNIKWYRQKNLERFKHILNRLNQNGPR